MSDNQCRWIAHKAVELIAKFREESTHYEAKASALDGRNHDKAATAALVYGTAADTLEMIIDYSKQFAP